MRFLPPEHFVGVLIDDAIDDARCAELLAELERRGFDATGERYPRDYRNNDRLVFDDPALAASLFAALGERIPREIVVNGARWQLCGFNPRFRACRYRAGQAFCIHRDGPHVPSDDVRSHLTVQLYLDDVADRVGGRTRFYADPQGNELWAAITPKRGAAIVFDHRAWHDGEAVTAGIKHVLRTDAMYRRLDAPAIERDVIGRHRGYAWRVITCRDGSLASSGRDGMVRRWNRAGRDGMVRRWNRAAREYALGAGSVTVLVEDARVRLWCGTRSGLIAMIEGDTITRVTDDVGAVLGACAIGERVVLATSRGQLLAFDAPGAPTWNATAHVGWAWCVTAVGESFASCGEDGQIALTSPRGHTRSFAELGVPLRVIAPVRDGLLVGDTRGWLHRIGREGDISASIRAHDGAITSLVVAADGTWVTASEDGYVKRWRDHQPVAATKVGDFVTSVAIDARGQIVCAGYDGAIWMAALTANTRK